MDSLLSEKERELKHLKKRAGIPTEMISFSGTLIDKGIIGTAVFKHNFRNKTAKTGLIIGITADCNQCDCGLHAIVKGWSSTFEFECFSLLKYKTTFKVLPYNEE